MLVREGQAILVDGRESVRIKRLIALEGCTNGSSRGRGGSVPISDGMDKKTRRENPGGLVLR